MVLVDILVKHHLLLSLEKRLFWCNARIEIEAPDLMFDFEIRLHEILKCGKIHFVLVDNGWFGDGVPVVWLVVEPQHFFEKFYGMAAFFVLGVVNIDCQGRFLDSILDDSFLIYFLVVDSICGNRKNPTVTNVSSAG